MDNSAEELASERPASPAPGRRMGLHLVHPTEPSSATTVDIVAIHGLGTDSSTTWVHWETNVEKDPGNTVNWLSAPTMLPEIVPNARIFTWDYDANYYKNASLQTFLSLVDDLLEAVLNQRKDGSYSTNPIIFIASCFGGILLERALIRASEIGGPYKGILLSTCGVIFLASPLRGCKVAKWAMQKIYFARIFGEDTSDVLVRDLDGESDVLPELLQRFSELANRDSTKIPLHCFYERRGSKILPLAPKEILVDMVSACIDGAPRTPFDVKHVMMNKFFHKDDHNFQKLANVILKFVDRVPDLMAKKKACSSSEYQRSNWNTHWMLRRSASSFFTGREKQMQIVETALRSPRLTTQGQPSVFLVTGKGGQGKTELCLKVAENLRREFWGVFWVDVSTADAADMGFAAINRKIGSSLADTDEKWLLILDNANDPDFDYTAYIPLGKQGSVLIISRNVDFKLGHFAAESVTSTHLYPLGERQSLDVLRKIVDIPSTKRLKAQGIAELLEFNPFALVQAGTYMARSPYSIDRCLKELEKHCGADSNTLRSIDRPESTHITIYAPLEALARLLESDHGYTGRDALKLLSVLCMLHHSGLPADAVKDAWNANRNAKLQPMDDTGSTDDLSQLSQYRKANFSRSFSFENAVAVLESYSLLSINSNGENDKEIVIHPLIQEWMRDRQNASEQLSSWIMAGSVLLTTREWSDAHSAHAYAFLDVRLHVLNQHSEPLPRKLSDMVVTIFCQLVNLLAQKDNMTSDDSRLVSVIDDIFCIMDTNPVLGPFKDLIPFFRGCISTVESPRRIEPLLALLDKNVKLKSPGKNWHLYLAKAYFRTGKPKDAVELLQSAIKEQHDMAKSDFFIAQAFLAAAHRQMRHFGTAIYHQKRAIRTALLILPETDPYIYSNVVFLGWLYAENGQAAWALRVLKGALQKQDWLYGTNNNHSLVTRHYISGLYRGSKQLDEAIRWQWDAVLLWRQRGHADTHPLRLRAERTLVSTCVQNGQYREVEQLLVSLVERYGREMDEVRTTDDFAEVLWNLAICYHETGRSADALRIMRQVVGMHQPGSVKRVEAEKFLREIRWRTGSVQ